MTGLVFRVCQRPGGWTVEHAGWTSAMMARADALDLAEGMAEVLRRSGDAAQVIVANADGTEQARSPRT